MSVSQVYHQDSRIQKSQSASNLNPVFAAIGSRYKFLANQHQHLSVPGLFAEGMVTDPLMQRVQSSIEERIRWISKIPYFPDSSVKVGRNQEKDRIKLLFSFLDQKSFPHQVAYKCCDLIWRNYFFNHYNEREQFRLANERIGLVVYAAERWLAKIASCIDVANIKNARASIFFEKKIEPAIEAIKKQVVCDLELLAGKLARQKELPFAQISPEIDSAKKAIAMAQILLTREGKLNFGMIPLIRETLFPKFYLSEQERQVLTILSFMNALWQNEIDSVEMPSEWSFDAKYLIRAELQLSPDEPITKYHCQLVVLTAILSLPYNQSAANHFLISVQTKQQEHFLATCFKQFKSILRDSCLSKNCNGEIQKFYFKTSLVNKFIQIPFTIDRDGKILEFGALPFWECPNLIAACIAMGILKPETLSTTILEELFQGGGSAKIVNWDLLIQAYAKRGSDRVFVRQVMLGRYGFSLDQNRLLLAWQTACIASDQLYESDSKRKKINRCVMKVLTAVFLDYKRSLKPLDKVRVDILKREIEASFNSSFHLIYDLGCTALQNPKGEYLTSHAFQLYQKNGNENSIGIRIETLTDFRQMVQQVVENLHKGKTNPLFEPLFIQLCQRLKSSSFTNELSAIYQAVKRNDLDPGFRSEENLNTPLTSAVDICDWETSAIGSGVPFIPHIQAVRPGIPEDWLKWLLSFSKWRQSTEHYLTYLAQVSEDPFTNFQNFCEIDFGNAEFQRFLASGQSVEDWIDANVTKVGKLVALSEVKPSFVNKFTAQILEWPKSLFQGLSPADCEEFENLLKTLSLEKINLQNYSQHVLDGLSTIFPIPEGQIHKVSFYLDEIIISSLEETDRQKILSTVFAFAKADWENDHSQDLHFCFYFNPRRMCIDFADIDLRNQHLTPMDQFNWL